MPRTYMWYCGVNTPRTIQQLALAISEKTLEELAKNGGIEDWTKKGIILPPTEPWEGSNTDEPNVIYEGNPQILTEETKVFKMWFRGARAIGYAESKDGITWVKYAGNPIISGYFCPFVFKHEGVYYFFGTTTDWDYFDLWTSTDGIHWTPYEGNPILSVGATGWDSYALGNKCVWVENGEWKMLYEAYGGGYTWQLGLATSPDGYEWTKYAGNPVLDRSPRCAGGTDIHLINGVYYLWFHGSPVSGSLPTQIYRRESENLLNWTDEKLVIPRTEDWEGSQTADPSILEIVPVPPPVLVPPTVVTISAIILLIIVVVLVVVYLKRRQTSAYLRRVIR